MRKMLSFVRTEPVVTGILGLDAAVAAVLSAVVALGVADLTPEQVAALVAVVTALSALVAPIIRSSVRPVATSVSVEEAEQAALAGLYVGLVESAGDDGAGASFVDEGVTFEVSGDDAEV